MYILTLIILKQVHLVEQIQLVSYYYTCCEYTVSIIGRVLTVTKQQFNIPDTTECRLWERYMTNSYELLTNLQQTVSDAGIYGGQVS